MDAIKILQILSSSYDLDLQVIFSKSTVAEIAPELKFKENGMRGDLDRLRKLVECFQVYEHAIRIGKLCRSTEDGLLHSLFLSGMITRTADWRQWFLC